MSTLADFDHPAWWTALGTLAGYGAILLVMTVALFLLPYALYASL